MNKDPTADLASLLFSAARQETPPEDLQDRITAALRSQPATPMMRVSNRSWGPRAWIALAAAALVGLVLIGTQGLRPSIIEITADDSLVMSNSNTNSKSEARKPSTDDTASDSTPALSTDTSQGIAADQTMASKPKLGNSPKTPIAKVRAPATLEQELASVQQARAALGSGNARAALAELDRFGRDLGWKQLAAESSLLRIEALAQVGRKSEAATAAERFVKQYPNNPLVDRAEKYTIEKYLAAPSPEIKTQTTSAASSQEPKRQSTEGR